MCAGAGGYRFSLDRPAHSLRPDNFTLNGHTVAVAVVVVAGPEHKTFFPCIAEESS